jgi:hypothetical protein
MTLLRLPDFGNDPPLAGEGELLAEYRRFIVRHLADDDGLALSVALESDDFVHALIVAINDY